MTERKGVNLGKVKEYGRENLNMIFNILICIPFLTSSVDTDCFPLYTYIHTVSPVYHSLLLEIQQQCFFSGGGRAEIEEHSVCSQSPLNDSGTEEAEKCKTCMT